MDILYFSLKAPYKFFIVSHEAGKIPSPILKEGVLDNLSELAGIAESCQKIIALVPGEVVSIYTLDLPIRSKKQALQAMPYALEEQLASPIHELEFFLLDWHPNGISTIAVVAKNLWMQYTQELADNQIFPNEITPDYALLPCEKGTAAVLFKENGGSRVLIRQCQSGRDLGIVLTTQELPYWLDECDANGLKVLCNDEQIFDDLSGHTDLNANIEFVDQWQSGLLQSSASYLDQNIKTKLVLQHNNHADKAVKKAKPWLIVSVLFFLLALVVFIASNVYESYLLDKQNKLLDEKIAQVFQDNFPSVLKIVDPKLQFRRELEQLQGSSKGSQEFLYLLNELVKSLPKNQIKITEIHYRESFLDVVLTMNDFEILDRFSEAVKTKNTLEFKQLSSDSQAGSVSAKYRFSTINFGVDNE